MCCARYELACANTTKDMDSSRSKLLPMDIDESADMLDMSLTLCPIQLYTLL